MTQSSEKIPVTTTPESSVPAGFDKGVNDASTQSKNITYTFANEDIADAQQNRGHRSWTFFTALFIAFVLALTAIANLGGVIYLISIGNPQANWHLLLPIPIMLLTASGLFIILVRSTAPYKNKGAQKEQNQPYDTLRDVIIEIIQTIKAKG